MGSNPTSPTRFKMKRSRYNPEANYFSVFDGKFTQRFKINNKDFEPLRDPEILDVSINSSCLAGCAFCSPGDTQIAISNSETINIDQIRIGDIILNCEDLTNVQFDIVDQIHVREYSGELIVIELEDTTLRLTPNHKVLTSRGEVRADELTINDEIYHL